MMGHYLPRWQTEPRHPLVQRQVNPASGSESSTQVAPFRQGFSPFWQCWFRLEHVRPFQPSTHRQTKSATISTHVPLLRQGFPAQSSTSANKKQDCATMSFRLSRTKYWRKKAKKDETLTVIAGESLVAFGANTVEGIDAVDASAAIPTRAIGAVVNVYKRERYAM